MESHFLLLFFHPSATDCCLTWDLKGELPCRLNKNGIIKRTVKTCGEITPYVCVSHVWSPSGINKASIYRSRWVCRSEFACAATVWSVTSHAVYYPFPCALFCRCQCVCRPDACSFDVQRIDWNRFPCVSNRLNVNNRMWAIHAVILTLSVWWASRMASPRVCSVSLSCVYVSVWERQRKSIK